MFNQCTPPTPAQFIQIFSIQVYKAYNIYSSLLEEIDTTNANLELRTVYGIRIRPKFMSVLYSILDLFSN